MLLAMVHGWMDGVKDYEIKNKKEDEKSILNYVPEKRNLKIQPNENNVARRKSAPFLRTFSPYHLS